MGGGGVHVLMHVFEYVRVCVCMRGRDLSWEMYERKFISDALSTMPVISRRREGGMGGKKEGRKDRINFDFTRVVDDRGK